MVCMCIVTLVMLISTIIPSIIIATYIISYSFYNSKHFFFIFLFLLVSGFKDKRHASSNIGFIPVCCFAEHSKYLAIFSLVCSPSPSEYVTIFLVDGSSSLKSCLVPTRIMGVYGEWWVISGCHLLYIIIKIKRRFFSNSNNNNNNNNGLSIETRIWIHYQWCVKRSPLKPTKVATIQRPYYIYSQFTIWLTQIWD